MIDMHEREEKLERALEGIAQWGDAYPTDIFLEPDWNKVRTALNIAGLSLDGVAASCMRHVAQGVAKIAREALE